MGKATAPQPWERQPTEGAEAFHAFSIYRDLGYKRSLDAVDRSLAEDGAGAVMRAPQTGSKDAPNKRRSGKTAAWSRKYSWVQRSLAWDDYVDRRIRERSLDEIEKMARRQAQHAELLMSVLMRPAVELAQALQDPNRAVALATAPIATLHEMTVEAATKIPRLQEAERLARGVRVMDVKRGPTQGGTAVFEVDVYQPPREGGEIDFSTLADPERAEWDGDRARSRDDD